jgi:hypothetical protein
MSEPGTGNSEAWKAIVEIAQDMLHGKMELIAGVRAIRLLAMGVGALSDAAMLPLLGVYSETDHLPRGESRGFYAKESLQRADEESAEYLVRRREFIFQACRELVAAHS